MPGTQVPSKIRFTPERLFRPRSIAVVGANTQLGASLLCNIALGAFRGRLESADSIDRLSSQPDLALIAAAVPEIEPLLSQLAAKGCAAAIVLRAVDGVQKAAQQTGVRVVGPHSFGLTASAVGLNASLSHIAVPPGRLALVSQSASICRTVIDWAGPNSVGFSHLVGLGEADDIGFSLVLDWLSRDPGTGSILLDIRRIKNPRPFLSAARAAAHLRPVVAVRPGLLLEDASGSAEKTFEAALRRAGVLSVPSVEELLAAAETLGRARPLRGETLAIVSNAVGLGQLASDAAMRRQIEVAELEFSGPASSSASPPETLASQAFALANRKDVGGTLVVHAPSGPGDDAAIRDLASAPPAAASGPLLVCATGETTGALHRSALLAAGLPVFASLEQAVRGFLHLLQDRRNRMAARELPPSAVLPLGPERQTVRGIFARFRNAGRVTTTQDEALAVLGAYGIPIVSSRCVTTPEDAVDAARLLGFPNAIKIREAIPPAERSRTGLALDLHTPGQALSAARLLLARYAQQDHTPELIVQQQAHRARELSIRVADDATFGPVIAFGRGGPIRPAAGDLGWGLPPVNLPLARALILRSRVGARLTQEQRDLPAIDPGPVAEALVRVSQLVLDFPQIARLEVTSLFADAEGVVAADAWICLRGPDEPTVQLAIAPYPAELVEEWVSGADHFIIHPVRPEDAEAHGAFFNRLAPVDIRYRFFTTIRELSREQIVRLTQIDYDREMAFIAVRPATGETVGVARVVCEPDDRSAEFAVIVQPDVKGKGLASHLMHRLIAWARQRGLREIVGQVLAENTPMLDFCRHLGFSLHRLAEEPDVIEARLVLD
ncbi:MAG: bifunctional acetate--CoA ligase family protein/GNAT family N-acetyltransferase [Acetobacteraceae bacterium]|nr:bifunctional acetate--CoA ligase family protein/GNAT family N-acetyltransferase [Acetobacteraceae bacterium]